ncbi:MAG: hypothetical protein SVY41_00820 [Candidatus Nanohaloarchaea archaeon]|nr:hypothetical protein [Candidatus Nanohaloarchaea archaeon]
MATLPGVAVQVLDAAWQVGRTVVPLLYLGFLGYGLSRHDPSVESVIASQRDYTLHVGVPVVGGLLAGALPVLALDTRFGLAVGGAITVAATVYAATDGDMPAPSGLDLGTWPDRLKLPWLLVPALAAAAIVTGDALLQSVTVLVFLSAVFWEV